MPGKRKIRNYVVNRSYQLRYVMIIVVLCATLLSVLGYYWYSEMKVASDIVEVNVIATMREGLARSVQEDIARHDQARILILVGAGVLLCLVIAGFTLIFTHRVAGPLYVLNRHMEQIKAGRLTSVRAMRKGDSIPGFFNAFHEMSESLRAQARQDASDLEAALKAAKDLPDDEAGGEARTRLLQVLGELHQRKVTALQQKDS